MQKEKIIEQIKKLENYILEPNASAELRKMYEEQLKYLREQVEAKC